MMDDIKRDIDKAIQDFRRYNAKAFTNVEKVINTAALVVERDAKKLFKGRDDDSIDGEPPRVDTGRLRASITHRLTSKTGKASYAEVGTNVEYGPYLEFGTSRSKGKKHPFMTPALEMNRAAIEKSIAEAVKKASSAGL
jgi:HK97 gp10 family phage protein